MNHDCYRRLGYRRLGRCIIPLVLVMASANAVAHESSKETSDCAGYDAAGQHVLQLMDKSPSQIKAGHAGTVLPQIKSDQSYRLELLPQSEVTFVTPPGRHTLAEGSFAGAVQFTTENTERYRINISDGSWVDVVSASGQLLESAAFNGRHQCQPLRKYVEYVLPANTRYTLQFSGGAKVALTLIITAVE